MTPRRLLSSAAAEPNRPERFEELMARLEKIVAEMETAELPLEQLLSSYEEGMRLVKACGDRLADADQKVEVLSKSMLAAEIKAAAGPESAGTNTPTDEIRLF